MASTVETLSRMRESRRRTQMAAVLCAVLVLACPLAVAYDDGTVVEETDAIPPVVFLIGAIIVFAVTAYATYSLASMVGDGSVPEGTVDDSVNATLRQLQAQLVTTNYDTASGIWSQLAVNDAQLWSFVETYFDIQAETAAASIWSDAADYDGDRVLELSSFLTNSAIYNYNITSAWNEFTESWSVYPDQWDDDDAYESMTVTFGWDGYGWDVAGTFSAELMRYVTPTSSSNRVYVDVVDVTEEGYRESTNVMYSVGGEGSLTSLTTGATYGLDEGENDLLGMGVPSGWYELGTGATYISANISGSVSAYGLMPSACMVLTGGSGFAYVYESGGSYVVVRDGASAVSDTLTLSVSYDDSDGDEVTGGTVDIGRVLSAYSDVSDALNHAALSANYAGEAAWNVYDMLGQSSTLISPTSITAGTQTDIPLTSEQAAVMYIAAMQQIAELGEGATSDGIRISPESLGLVLFGDIYYEGVLIAEGAVYTPFVYSDATISVGRQTLGVNGIAMVWAIGLGSLDEWDGVTSGSTLMSVSGATLDTYNIVDDGTEVSSVTLEVASMERLGLIGFDVPDVPDTPTTVDVVPLMQIILVLIGAVVAIAGLATRNPWLILIGILVAVLGYLLAGWIASLIW